MSCPWEKCRIHAGNVTLCNVMHGKCEMQATKCRVCTKCGMIVSNSWWGLVRHSSLQRTWKIIGSNNISVLAEYTQRYIMKVWQIVTIYVANTEYWVRQSRTWYGLSTALFRHYFTAKLWKFRSWRGINAFTQNFTQTCLYVISMHSQDWIYRTYIV